MNDMKLDIQLDLGNQLDLSAGINAQVMPMLAQAVRAVAQHTALNWQQRVYAGKMWSGEKDAYAQSITWQMTGDFSAVVRSDYAKAQEIETGRPARDLKQMLNTSLKVRRSTKGKRFLVIPMRHNTPGHNAHANAMPQGIYDLVKEMSASTVIGQSSRPVGEVTHLSPKTGMSPSPNQSPYLSNTTGGTATTPRHHYQWGQRLTTGMMKAAGINVGQNRHLVGAYRFDTSTPGGGKSSQYLSFRIMMDGQSGWVIPAQPGQYLAKKTVDAMRPKAQQAFQQAIKLSFG